MEVLVTTDLKKSKEWLQLLYDVSFEINFYKVRVKVYSKKGTVAQ